MARLRQRRDGELRVILVGLELPPELGFEEWAELGRGLARAENTLQWQIGDWWSFGKFNFEYGRRSQIVEDLGLNVHTCENAGWVARAFQETSRRREALSFAHHEAVAALPAAEADELLAWCLEDVVSPRSVRALRTERARRAAEYAARVERAAMDLVITKDVHRPRTVTLIIEAKQRQPCTATVHRLAPELPARPTPRPLSLDNSGTHEPVAAELAVEPRPPIDRVTVAAAALAHLRFEPALRVFLNWYNQRTEWERKAIRETIWDSSERQPTAGREEIVIDPEDR